MPGLGVWQLRISCSLFCGPWSFSMDCFPSSTFPLWGKEPMHPPGWTRASMNAQRSGTQRLWLSLTCSPWPFASWNVRQQPPLGFSLTLVLSRQWGIRIKTRGQFFYLRVEKFKSTQFFLKAREKASLQAPRALEHMELLAAVLAREERTREKAFSSRDCPSPPHSLHSSPTQNSAVNQKVWSWPKYLHQEHQWCLCLKSCY